MLALKVIRRGFCDKNKFNDFFFKNKEGEQEEKIKDKYAWSHHKNQTKDEFNYNYKAALEHVDISSISSDLEFFKLEHDFTMDNLRSRYLTLGYYI